jgi:hypothetical protein
MARGFESKDVEYQQAEAQRPKSRSIATTPEQRDALERRRTLELALARAESERRAASSEAHQQMLDQAIAALRARLDADLARSLSGELRRDRPE